MTSALITLTKAAGAAFFMVGFPCGVLAIALVLGG